MDVDVQNTIYDEKIEQVLKKLAEPNFKIKNDVYLNSLLTHIAKYQEKSHKANDKDNLTSLLSYWIIHSVQQWECSTLTISPEILSFTLNLASVVSKDETVFVKFNSSNVYERFIKIADSYLSVPSVKLGFITLLTSFLEHKCGLQWIMATNFWTDILSFTLKAHTLYIKSAGCKFLVEVLDKSVTLNETFCQNVIRTLLDPLDIETSNVPHGNIIKNDVLADSLYPVLRLLIEILHLLLKRTSTAVMDMVVHNFQLSSKIKKILLVAQTEDFEFELRRVMFLMGFVDLYKYFSGRDKIIYVHVAERKEEGIFETLKALIGKGHVKSVLRLCYDGLLYWSSIGNKMPKCFQKDQQIELEIQLMIIQIIPVMVAGAAILGPKNFEKLLLSDGFRDDYITKTLKVSGTRTIQAGYQWRNFMFQDPNVFDNTTLCLMYILKSKSFYTREGGVISFQAFIYCLKDIITHLKVSPPNMSLPSEQTKFLESVLEATGVFIEEFNITWKDSIESMCATNLAVELLQFTMWTPKVVAKALNLLNITISKYMSPSMALLVDSSHDSSLSMVGVLLYAKCHDPYWEVRDSSLEVLCTMSYNANTRFPSFQKIILDAELPHLIVKMAINDTEAFVRASALRCLQQMIQVQEFWSNLLKIENMHEQFFDVVRKETEGIVRKEAATLICKIYDHQNYEEPLLANLYDIMTHAAIADLHWEVKLNALNFWQSVVNRHLQHQGMLDGTFPKVTFSKENRKIVNLNDTEVKKRLVKVLNQLSETGCLAVFVAAIQDDCDIQVSKSATNITNDFITLLKRYEVTAQNSNLSQPPSPLNNTVRTYSESQCGSPFPDIGSPSSSYFNSDSPAYSHNSNSPISQNLPSPSSSNFTVLQNSPNLMQPVSPFSQDSAGFYSPQIFHQFNPYFSQSTNTFNTFEMEQQDTSYSTRASEVTDAVLDEILDSSDINLLKTIYNPNDNVYGAEVFSRQKVVLSPSDFLTFTYGNLDSNFIEKSKWLNGLDDFRSLLDDILKDYDVNDVNVMDCY